MIGGSGLWIFVAAVEVFAVVAMVWLIYLACAMPVSNTQYPDVEDDAPIRGIRCGCALCLPLWIAIFYFGWWMLS